MEDPSCVGGDLAPATSDGEAESQAETGDDEADDDDDDDDAAEEEAHRKRAAAAKRARMKAVELELATRKGNPGVFA